MGLLDWLRRARTSSPTDKPTTSDPNLAERKITRVSAQGRQGVAGEHYHQRALRTVVGRRHVASVGNWDGGLPVDAYLVREPANRHDKNAIMVQVARDSSTEHVGYLPATVAPRWQPILQALESEGRVAECPGRVFRDGSSELQLVLHLAAPEHAQFGNAEPDDAHLLEPVRQCAVTRVGDHQDVLARSPIGLVWATLHAGTVPSGKYAGQDTLEVRIDGDRVGVLNAAQGQRYMSVLERGSLVACEAEVYDASGGRGVRLMLPKVD